MEPILQLKDVVKRYGTKPALSGVSFEVGPGKIIGLLGSNGSGKTTIMKLAAGLMQPTSGSVAVCGLPTGKYSKACTAFMPDKPLTESWMKVRDAIAFSRDLYPDFDDAKARDMLSFMQLNPDDKTTSLSKGMNERLQLTLTISRNAKLYLLDEPIGGVDPVARDKILDAIVQYYNEESSLIISTHLVRDIERIFDEVLFIKEGKVALHEAVDDLRMKYGKGVDEMFKEVYAQ
ncbi:ABC transporter ATP-binding protein [Paenibacillus agaridevorans]|jgi:ABC-2 type transport system ATP-binding protein|uniref:ABC transporter ATP-binding protein n=1 Tax=Paenibacillus agaridevorans TaxID=171404 RepID=A0A2R5EHJ1_9BACL|nr:ABC transporter ATP-binding protein [Paenibacillus agaridevorans]GBG06040.1 ABC transporter ATP-binding protein [Paenibacillus agaridevorans]